MKTNTLILILTLLTAGAYASADKKQLQLNFKETSGGVTDIASIYMDNGINTNFVAQEDMAKNLNEPSGRPLIYSFTSDKVSCYSNGFGDFSQTVSIPVGIKVTKGGTFEIAATAISGFDATSIIRLHDRVTGTYIDMRQGAYTIVLNVGQQIDDRLVLLISLPATVNAEEAGCFNNDGVISVTPDNSITWTSVQLYNSQDSLIGQQDNVDGAVSFSGLPMDYYNVNFVYQTYTSLKVAYVSTHQILLNIGVSTPEPLAGQMLKFSSAALNTDNYEWTFGDRDGTRINGVANPEFVYYEPGTYTATLTVSNAHECSAESSLIITVAALTSASTIENDKINFIVKNRNIIINAADYENSSYTYELYNLAGQLLFTNPITSPNEYISMNNESTGIYVMNIKSRDGKAITRKLFVE